MLGPAIHDLSHSAPPVVDGRAKPRGYQDKGPAGEKFGRAGCCPIVMAGRVPTACTDLGIDPPRPLPPRHGPACPGHLYPHVPRQMARTSRAMTMRKCSQPSSKHLISWDFMAVSEMCASRRACPSHPPPAVEARMAGTRPTACTDLGNDPLRPCLIPSWPGSSGPSIQGRGEDRAQRQVDADAAVVLRCLGIQATRRTGEW